MLFPRRPRPVAIAAEEALRAVPLPNLRARALADTADGLELEVDVAWTAAQRVLGPLLRLRRTRRYLLEGLGLLVWRRIDGRRTLGELIAWLEEEEGLTFHEARLLLGGWLDLLSRRGLVVAGLPGAGTAPGA